MGGRFALPQLLVSRVQRVIHLVDFQNFVPAQNYQRFIYRQAHHFVWGQHRSLSDTTALAVLRRIVGDAQGTQCFGGTGHCHTGNAGALGNVLSCQLIRTAKKKLHIAVAENFLPLVLRVAVLQAGKILEYARHGDVAGADNADTPG